MNIYANERARPLTFIYTLGESGCIQLCTYVKRVSELNIDSNTNGRNDIKAKSVIEQLGFGDREAEGSKSMRYILNRIAKFLSENGRHKNLYTNVNEIEIEKKIRNDTGERNNQKNVKTKLE